MSGPTSAHSPVCGQFRGGSTLTSIKNFKGGHLQTSLIAIVVREFSKWKRFLPFLAEGDDTSSKHIFKHLIDSFNLALRLRVISSTEFQMSAHSFLETIPELGGENAATILTDLQRNTMEGNNSGNI